ncbi:methylphosphotriester-DNA--protein-cysteine methyltransferase [Mucilaginibacter sp. UYP25]|uniref:Ada metal-binding domain-containing protein n=1 Tax=unclassified Mucilaginibacter TaxID=2617802 RepID=UPI003392DC61
MIRHIELGKSDFSRSKALKSLIEAGKIALGGNRKLKIYGTLRCASGKRMKVDNRVFFTDEQEAIEEGYRPCGHCMREVYQKWKALN